MDGAKVYGGSDMIALLDNSTNSLWVPSSSHTIHETMLISFDHEIQQGRRSSPRADRHLGSDVVEETGEEFDTSGGFHQPAEKKRRLTEGQVEFLEKNFEVENKLEPERKLQIANQLGLEPRQVAIWFQNRRARFKIKQLEKDYDSLKATYDKLKVDYDSLLEEREGLQNEVKVLTNKLKQKNTGWAKLDPNSPDNQLYSELHDKGNPEIKSKKIPKMEGSMKQVEDASSAKSDVLDSDSPNCTDVNHSPFLEGPNCTHILDPNEECNGLIMSKSLLFQPTPTITSYSNENNYMVKIEDNVTCNLSLVEDQPFWSLLY